MIRRTFPLLAALWLQLAPLVVRLEPVVAPLAQPLALILRWLACGSAVSGAFHAVSGATGLTVTTGTATYNANGTIPATNGVTFSARFSAVTGDGIPKTYRYSGLPPGLAAVAANPANVQGKPTQAGTFTTRVTGWENANATGHSVTFSIKFLVTTVLPTFQTQPTGQVAMVGGTATFSVVASGVPPLTYQWTANDVSVPGATSATLVLTNVSLASAGTYRVQVTSASGSVWSDPATLVVTAPPPPVIVNQPSSQKVLAGGPATFSVTATGEGTLRYAWLKGGVEIAGATNATLVLTSVLSSDAGEYRVRVRNDAAEVLSDPAVLTVDVLPVVLGQSSDVIVYPGEVVRLAVAVKAVPGLPAPAVSWLKDGVDVAGVATTNLVLDPVRSTDAGVYRARAVASGGAAQSGDIRVTVLPLPVVAPVVDADGLRFRFSSVPGREYVLQARESLDGPWQARQTLRPGTNVTVTLPESSQAAAQFYRLGITPLP